MNIENRTMTILKKLAVVILMLFSVSLLSGCADDDGGSSEETVTKLGYTLNYNQSYHRVVRYIATDNGDDTYEVTDYSVHLFSISNENYKSRTGGELCDIVKTSAVKESSKYESVLQEDKTSTLTSSKGTLTFYLHKGLKCYVYYYF